MAFVAWFAVGSAALLHLRLEHMAHTLLQLLAHTSFMVAEHRPVGVVELLNDLERPASVQNIATDHLVLESVGDRAVPGLAQLVARFAEQKIGMTHQLMERVQMATRSLDEFPRL